MKSFCHSPFILFPIVSHFGALTEMPMNLLLNRLMVIGSLAPSSLHILAMVGVATPVLSLFPLPFAVVMEHDVSASQIFREVSFIPRFLH